MSIYQSAVKKPITTALVFVAVAIFGLFSLINIPIDLIPEIETNTIMVMTTYQGANASDIENNVTKPLENVLNRVSDLKHITSKSKENVSIVTLEFEYGIDIDVATNDVRDKLDMVTSALPDNVDNPIIFKFGADDIPILLLSVTAKESSPGLYKILDDVVANPLARIGGVGTVSISGAPQRELTVYCDPHKLEAYNISIETIAGIIAAENRNTPAGQIDVGSNTYSLRVQKEFTSADDMKMLVVGVSAGKPVYLKDVATIRDGLEERSKETYNNGEKGGMIIIQKQSGANSVKISNKVMEMLPSLQAKLPSDVKVNVIVNTSDNIVNTIMSLGETILITLLLVMVVVYVFLGRWRATFIIMLTVPISLLASLIYLFATGNSLNIISLSSLSIAIGMVVDDAIVVLENVTTHIERGSRPKSAAVYATNEVAISVIASTLTMLAVFTPDHLSFSFPFIDLATFSPITMVIPYTVFFVALLGVANSLVWPAIWPLSLDGVGSHTKTASALIIMSIAGGALLPLAYGKIAEMVGTQQAYWIALPCYLIILSFAIFGCKWGKDK